MIEKYLGYIIVMTIAVLGILWMLIDYYRETHKGNKK